MSEKKETVLVKSDLIACNQVCANLKDVGISYDSIWMYISHFIKNIDLINEGCFTDEQIQTIKESYDDYIKLVGTVDGSEKKQKLGLDFARDIDNMRKIKSLKIVSQEREFTSKLLEAIGNNLDDLYAIVNSSAESDLLQTTKGLTMQAIKKSVNRDEILQIVENGFSKLNDQTQKIQGEIRQSIDNMLVLESHALLDKLTGILNRRFYDQELPRVVKLFLDKKGRVPFSLLIMDLDNFKYVNDQYGHFSADIVLKRFAEIIQKNSRAGIDSPIRLGGDEFALFLVGSNSENASKKAKNIWREISEQEFHKVDQSGGEGNESFRVTVSIGISELDYNWKDIPTKELHRGTVYCDPENNDPLYKMTCKISEAADSALYDAKEAGRSRIHIYRHNKGRTRTP